jgi:A/G-specific adenine glycosylase
MLRRTRAAQVAPVFQAFIHKFPTASDLFQADPVEVTESVASLGLSWRLAQFHALANDLVAKFDGRVPCDRAELASLTGVSDYVADAVLVFACNKPRSVIDANVARVITRYFGLREHAEARRDRIVRELADELLHKRNPRDYNFAMLDLAALVCRARNPLHEECPLRRTCVKGRSEAA